VRVVIAEAPFATVAARRTGTGRIAARAEGGRTVLDVLHAASPLRFLRPVIPTCDAAVVCLVTFGGGLVDGDSIALDVKVGPGAVVVLFTQSSTKVFRGASRQTISAEIEGTFVLLPDPVAAFASARYTQRVDVSLRGAGTCVLLDAFTSGRAAYGERWRMDALDTRTTVTRDGATILRDALVLDRADGSIAERMGRFDAMATLAAFGGIAPDVGADAIVGEDLVVASSKLANEGAIARIAGRSPARVLTEVRRRIRNIAEMGAVDPFASRHGCT
jgi:urease accessory protein